MFSVKWRLLVQNAVEIIPRNTEQNCRWGMTAVWLRSVDVKCRTVNAAPRSFVTGVEKTKNIPSVIVLQCVDCRIAIRSQLVLLVLHSLFVLQDTHFHGLHFSVPHFLSYIFQYCIYGRSFFLFSFLSSFVFTLLVPHFYISRSAFSGPSPPSTAKPTQLNNFA